MDLYILFRIFTDTARAVSLPPPVVGLTSTLHLTYGIDTKTESILCLLYLCRLAYLFDLASFNAVDGTCTGTPVLFPPILLEQKL